MLKVLQILTKGGFMKNFFKGTAIAIAAFIAIYFIGDYVDTKKAEEYNNQYKKSKVNATDSYNENNVDESLYDVISEGIEDREGKIVIKYDCTDELFDTYAKVLSDHPEFFWVTRGSKYSSSVKGDKVTITFTPEYYMTDEEIEAGQGALELIKENILSGLNPNATDYEKVLYIHDYIINTTVYDSASAEENDGSGKKLSDNVYKSASVYGCLVEGKAICTGYSAAFQYLIGELGLESGRVSGYTVDGSATGHQWNYVSVDGEYYYIDLTWDDPVYENGKDVKKYTYFLVTEEEIELTHTFGSGFTKPDCSSTRYNYFVYNGLYVGSYDYSKVSDIISRNFSDGEVEMKFASPEELQKAVEQLFDNKGIWNIYAVKRLNIKTVYHSVSKNGLILRITTTE